MIRRNVSTREKILRGTNIFMFLMAVLFMISWFYFLSTIDHDNSVEEDQVPVEPISAIKETLASKSKRIAKEFYDNIFFNLRTISDKVPDLQKVNDLMNSRAKPSQCDEWLAQEFDLDRDTWKDWKTGMSQAGQDRYLAEKIFKRKESGVFIDIGAYDGETYSSSWLLEKCYRWKGICFEPGDINNLIHKRDCIVYRGGASNGETGKCQIEFMEDGSVQNNICFNLQAVEAFHGVTEVDLLIINRRGHNLKSLDRIAHNVKVIAVEDGNPHYLVAELQTLGFKLAKQVGVHQIYTKE